MTRATPTVRKPAVLVSFLALTAAFAVAQQPPPASQPPATQPADRTVVLARVLEVQGDAQFSPLGAEDWKPCKAGEEYPELTQIRTGVRSSVKLQIGSEEPYTALVIESVSRTVLSEAYKTKDTKRVRVGVGYGKVRAGVAEGGLKSDFTVDSPVATLSKKGTWDFGLFYERGTDRFEVFLLDRGLVDVLDQMSGQRRALMPRELVTQAMMRWFNEAQIQRNVPIIDLFGQGQVDLAFNRLRTEGLGVIDAGAGQAPVLDLSNARAQAAFGETVRNILPPNVLPGEGPLESRLRAEGFFGTGRGDELIKVIIDSNSSLARDGFARPGTYMFRRAALEGWLRQTGGRR